MPTHTVGLQLWLGFSDAKVPLDVSEFVVLCPDMDLTWEISFWNKPRC